MEWARHDCHRDFGRWSRKVAPLEWRLRTSKSSIRMTSSPLDRWYKADDGKWSDEGGWGQAVMVRAWEGLYPTVEVRRLWWCLYTHNIHYILASKSHDLRLQFCDRSVGAGHTAAMPCSQHEALANQGTAALEYPRADLRLPAKSALWDWWHQKNYKL